MADPTLDTKDTSVASEVGANDVPESATAKDSPSASSTADRGASGFTYKEDRSKWIPPHRLTEESSKRQTLEQRAAQLERELEQERRRVRAAMGVETPDPDEQQRQEIINSLKRISPKFAKLLDLDDAKFDALLGTPDQLGNLTQVRDFVYGQVADRMMSGVESAIAEELGSDLTAKQKQVIGLAYYQRAESDPEFLARHEAQDPTLIDEFVKEYVDEWVAPIRRNVTRTNVERATNARVPRGRDRAVVVQGKPNIDYSNEDAVNKAALQRFKDLGGNFNG